MELRTTDVSKCLDKKLMVLGFEVPDLLAIFLTLSILNFLFGTTDMKLILIWFPSIALAATLRIGKRGKPDNFLIHWVRFQIKPGVLSAFKDSSEWAKAPRLKRR